MIKIPLGVFLFAGLLIVPPSRSEPDAYKKTTTDRFSFKLQAAWPSKFNITEYTKLNYCLHNEVPIFNHEQREYFCACQEKFFWDGSVCASCTPDEICIRGTDRAFECDPDVSTHNKMAPLDRFYPSVQYCIPKHSYRLYASYHETPGVYPIFTRTNTKLLYEAVLVEEIVCAQFQHRVDGECKCMEGFFLDTSGKCSQCKAGSFCRNGEQFPCLSGQSSLPQSSSANDCSITLCSPGEFMHGQKCMTCPRTHYCVGSNQAMPCPPNSESRETGASFSDACICMQGYEQREEPNAPAGFVCAVSSERYLHREESVALTLPNGHGVDMNLYGASRVIFTGTQAAKVYGAFMNIENLESSVHFLVVTRTGLSHSVRCDIREFFDCSASDFLVDVATGVDFVMIGMLLCFAPDAAENPSHILSVSAAFLDGAMSCGASSTEKVHADLLAWHKLKTFPAIVSMIPHDDGLEEDGVVVERNILSVYDNLVAWDGAEAAAEFQSFLPAANSLQNVFQTRQTVAGVLRHYRVQCQVAHQNGLTFTEAAIESPTGLGVTKMYDVGDKGTDFCIDVENEEHPVHVIPLNENTTAVTVMRGYRNVLQWPHGQETQFNATNLKQDLRFMSEHDQRICYNRTIANDQALTIDIAKNIAGLNTRQCVRNFVSNKTIVSVVHPQRITGWEYTENDITLFLENSLSGPGTTNIPIATNTSLFDFALPLNFCKESAERKRYQLYEQLFNESRNRFFDCIQDKAAGMRIGETDVYVHPDYHMELSLTGAWKKVQVHVVDGNVSSAATYCFSGETCNPVSYAKKGATSDTTEYQHELGDTLLEFTSEDNKQETWSLVRYTSRLCPQHSHTSPDSKQACICNVGYKNAFTGGGMHCVPCLEREICNGKASVASICDLRRNESCACPRGYRFHNGTCQQCHDDSTVCQKGVATFCGEKMRQVVALCVCRDGYHATTTGAFDHECLPCPKGWWCQDGSARRCDQNLTTEFTHSTKRDACMCGMGYERQQLECRLCPHGKYKVKAGNFSCESCTQDQTTTMLPGAKSHESCVCRANTRLEKGKCVHCDQEHEVCINNTRSFCPNDRIKHTVANRCVCKRGMFENREKKCVLCPSSYYCLEGRLQSCPVGMTSLPGSMRAEDCTCQQQNRIVIAVDDVRQCACQPSFYEQDGECMPCPQNSLRLLLPHTSSQQSDVCICQPGFWKSRNLDGSMQCVLCPQGSFCPGITRDQQKLACPKGTFSIFFGLRHQDGCIHCNHTDAASQQVAYGHGSSTPVQCHSIYFPLQLTFPSDENALVQTPVFDIDAFATATFKMTGECQVIENEVESRFGQDHGIVCFPEGTKCACKHTIKFLRMLSMQLHISETSLLPALVHHLATHNEHYDVIIGYIFCDLLARLSRDMSEAGLCYFPRAGLNNDALQSVARDANKNMFRNIFHSLHSRVKVTDELEQSTTHFKTYRILISFFQREFAKKVGVRPDDIRTHLHVLQVSSRDHNVVAFFPVSERGVQIIQHVQKFAEQGVLNEIRLRYDLNIDALHGTALTRDLCNVPIVPNSEMDRTFACSVYYSRDGLTCEPRCDPSTHFWSKEEQCVECTSCSDGIKTPCCAQSDTVCITPPRETNISLTSSVSKCGNGVIDLDLGEECDVANPLPGCQCTQFCRLFPGIYNVFTHCRTWCGDQIVAGSEECDNLLDQNCNPSTCLCHEGMRFHVQTQMCGF